MTRSTRSELSRTVEVLEEATPSTPAHSEQETIATQVNQATMPVNDPKATIPNPKFKGPRGDDIRQWLFQVETICRINHHKVSGANTILPPIAGTSMEEPAAGWFLRWAYHAQNIKYGKRLQLLLARRPARSTQCRDKVSRLMEQHTDNTKKSK